MSIRSALLLMLLCASVAIAENNDPSAPIVRTKLDYIRSRLELSRTSGSSTFVPYSQRSEWQCLADDAWYFAQDVEEDLLDVWDDAKAYFSSATNYADDVTRKAMSYDYSPSGLERTAKSYTQGFNERSALEFEQVLRSRFFGMTHSSRNSLQSIARDPARKAKDLEQQMRRAVGARR